MLDALATLIRDRKVILFAGSGLPATLGLPTWAGLMSRIAEELGFDPDVLIPPGANYLTIADYYVRQKGGIGALRSWMDKAWHVDDATLEASTVYKDIVNLEFPFLYTTNYDRSLERMFELRGAPFSKITSAASIAKSSPIKPHIVKFHGDFDDDNSLVLAETKYFERLAFEDPLDIKLRADALGRSLLFVGYSLSDINMRLLLYRLQKTWEASGEVSHRPKSFVFMARPDPVQESVLSAWGVEPIVADVNDISEALPWLFGELTGRVSRI